MSRTETPYSAALRGNGTARRPGRPKTTSNGSRMHKITCAGCGCLMRVTVGSILRARGLPTCACGGDFKGEPIIEGLFDSDRTAGNGKDHA